MGASGYDAFYRDFDSPLMRRIRAEAYGEDIGQHSWVTADELRSDLERLSLDASSRFIDLGCGPAGPLTYALAAIGCHGTGVDASATALGAGRTRAEALGVAGLITLTAADLDAPLPFEPRSFDAAVALDVVLHLRERARFYREVARILRPGGRLLITDAGVVTGAVSAEELERRSPYMHTTFVPPGLNESLLGDAGFTLLETEDRTPSARRNAAGRLRAMRAHRRELETASGPTAVAVQENYLSVIVELSDRRALARVMYLATRR